MENINLLIFDEMHAAFKDMLKPSNHAYSRIMQFYHGNKNEQTITIRPRIIALSASVFNNFSPSVFKDGGFEAQLKKCETLYDGTLTTGGFFNKANFVEKIEKFNSRFEFNILFDFKKLFEIFGHYRISYLKQYQLAFVKINKLCSEMGVWFAYQFARICRRSLMRNEDECGKIMSKILNCYLKSIRSQLKVNNSTINNIILDEKFISNKIFTLLKLIEQFENFGKIGILFVNERADANVIYRWLKQLSTIPLYNFIKPGFICGDFKKNFIDFDHIKSCHQYLDKLRNNEINFMVATSVFEEGILILN